MTRLELRNLVKRFDEVIAVDGISLTVEPGQLVALLGPSGCGKTTTLRMIAGLEVPTAGDIRFGQESVVAQATHTRNIGMVFQRYVLFPHMSVKDNVSFGLRMRRTDRKVVDERVAEVLDIVQLSGLENRFPSQLSGGQQQRVAIARTVITDPRVMLMDEPLANLDAKLRDEMRAFITDLQKRLDITTIFVTHDQIEAIELADKIGVMFAGRIVQFGTPEDIFNRPRTPKIAEFMGTTNLIEGDVASAQADCIVLDTAVGKLGVRPTAGAGTASSSGAESAGVARHSGAKGPNTLRTGLPRSATGRDAADGTPPSEGGDDPIRVGQTRLATVRPEHIDVFLKDDRPADGANVFHAEIIDSVYYGGTVTYRVRSESLALTVRDRSTRRLHTGEGVIVRIPQEHLWIFPATSP